ncbi:MAG: hypothetical protein AB1778_00365 [Candidatus Bipolaricaulota bacterium]
MERAITLIRPYAEREDVVGAYLVGSSTRPQTDGLSDLDIEVILEDRAYEMTTDAERHAFTMREGNPRVVDYEIYLRPWSEFVGLTRSTQDLFHYPYQHARILHDPEGRIERVVAALAELPPLLRFDRLRVHYLEFRFALGRARKTRERGGALNLRLLYADALAALVKTLFLAASSWPSTHHWSEQELRHLGVPASLLDATDAAFTAPATDAMADLVRSLDTWLDSLGETFHHDTRALVAWAFLRAEGRRAFEVWSGR